MATPRVNPHNRPTSRKATQLQRKRRKNQQRTLPTRRPLPNLIQRKTPQPEQTPAIPPAAGLRNRPRERRTRPATRGNHPTLPTPQTRDPLPVRQRLATLATPPVRGPHRRPRTNSQRPRTATGWYGSIRNPAFTTNRVRDGTARPSRANT